MRLVAVALSAWGAAALGLCVSGWVAVAGSVSCGLAAAVLVVLVRGAGHGWRSGRRPLAVTAAAALLAGSFAGGAAGLHAADVRRGPVPELAARGASVTVELTVTGDPFRTRGAVHGSQQTPGAVMFRAEATRVTGPGEGGGRVTHRVRTPVLVVRQETGDSAAWRGLLPSTRLRVRAEPAPPAGGGPVRDIAALLRVRGEGAPHLVREPSAAQRTAGKLRAGLRDASDGLGRDERGLLPGLVVGDTSRVPADLEAAFRATDMTHLLAVSGSNLMILLVLLIGPPGRAQLVERRGLAPRLGLSLRTTAVLAALLTLGFVLVCRPDASVLRAAACGLVTVLAIATGRRRSLLPALAAAVLALVLYDPWLAADFGFLLSVLATGSLLTLAPRWSRTLRRRGVPGRLAELLAAAAAAQAVCAPVVAVLAAHVSLVAVPCNLLAELVVAPATVLGFAALAVAPLAAAPAEWLARLASWPVSGVAGIARTGAALPGSEVAWPGSWTGALLLALLTALTLYLAVRVRLLCHPWWCALCASLLLVALARPVPLVRPLTGWPPAGWRAVVCDVGQGDATVLATGRKGEAVVVDAGPEPEAVDGCLRRLGVTAVPVLVLTHFHADHVTGLPGVLKGRTVAEVRTTTLDEPPGQAEFVRRTARAAGVPVAEAVAGERQRSGGLSWEVLWPPAPDGAPVPPSGANDASVTLLVRSSGLSLFLPGDLEPESQRRLLTAYPELPRVDVLKVAHHGSAYQYPRLLRQLRPRVALISSGAGNPYGHPAPRTVTAFRDAGAAVARTDRQGALAVVPGRGAARPSGPGEPDDAPAAVVAERGTSSGARRPARRVGPGVRLRGRFPPAGGSRSPRRRVRPPPSRPGRPRSASRRPTGCCRSRRPCRRTGGRG
ncbi:ComEC/Rec2 family competence protein [Streptomyces sp. HNM0574]|uniref:ComEC/Rec2 family competence protein n=1 Tax=Streptomyces sp. HNM0574 TaxID=2714954 RepID=UPI001F0ED49E|nr:ComEC/Rec2 family competence protein [Streptomyces sp. HNM0574]